MGSLMSLICGDCLDCVQDIPDASISAVIADPPYGTTSCKWDTVIPLEPLWVELKRVLRPNGVVVLTASQPFTSVLVMSNVGMFRHEWVWIKNRGSNFANTCREPMKEHEVVLVFSAGRWTYNKQMQSRSGAGSERAKYLCAFNTSSDNYRQFEGREHKKLSELRVPSSWQKFNTATGREKLKHPTQKPLALMDYLVKTYTDEGDTVLDFCMGSGTTGEACVQNKRKFVGIEKDETYFKMASDRLGGFHSRICNASIGGNNG